MVILLRMQGISCPPLLGFTFWLLYGLNFKNIPIHTSPPPRTVVQIFAAVFLSLLLLQKFLSHALSCPLIIVCFQRRPIVNVIS